MTAQSAFAPTAAGTTVTEQSCTTTGVDSIPDSCVLLVRNTGAGTHIFSVSNAATFDGLSAATTGAAAGIRQYTLTTGQVMTVRVPDSYGDVNGRCNIFADGTPSEVKYTVIGAY